MRGKNPSRPSSSSIGSFRFPNRSQFSSLSRLRRFSKRRASRNLLTSVYLSSSDGRPKKWSKNRTRKTQRGFLPNTLIHAPPQRETRSSCFCSPIGGHFVEPSKRIRCEYVLSRLILPEHRKSRNQRKGNVEEAKGLWDLEISKSFGLSKHNHHSVKEMRAKNPKITPHSPCNRQRRRNRKRDMISSPPKQLLARWLRGRLPPYGFHPIGEESICHNRRRGAVQRARRLWVWERTRRGWNWKGGTVGFKSDGVKWLKAARLVSTLGQRSKMDKLIYKPEGDCSIKGRKLLSRFLCWKIWPPRLSEGDLIASI